MNKKVNVQLTELQVQRIIKSIETDIRAKNKRMDELMDAFNKETKTEKQMEYAIQYVSTKGEIERDRKLIHDFESTLYQHKPEEVKHGGKNSDFGFREAYIFVL